MPGTRAPRLGQLPVDGGPVPRPTSSTASSPIATSSKSSTRSPSPRDGSVRRAVDYKNLGSEELGSVYQGLLELHPQVNADAGTFVLETASG